MSLNVLLTCAVYMLSSLCVSQFHRRVYHVRGYRSESPFHRRPNASHCSAGRPSRHWMTVRDAWSCTCLCLRSLACWSLTCTTSFDADSSAKRVRDSLRVAKTVCFSLVRTRCSCICPVFFVFLMVPPLRSPQRERQDYSESASKPLPLKYALGNSQTRTQAELLYLHAVHT